MVHVKDCALSDLHQMTVLAAQLIAIKDPFAQCFGNR